MLNYIFDETPKFMLILRKDDGENELVPMTSDELYDVMVEAEEARRNGKAMTVGVLFRKEALYGREEKYVPYYERLVTLDGSNWHKSHDYIKPTAWWDMYEDEPTLTDYGVTERG